MTEPAKFLHAFAQALSVLSLYPEGHTTRERALDTLYQATLDLLSKHKKPSFSFLGNEVVFGELPLREMRDWDWSERLAGVGIERVEVDETVTRDEIEAFLDELLARLTLQAIDTTEARQTRTTGIRYGVVGVGDEGERGEGITTAAMEFTLGEEAETIRWLHSEISSGAELPLGEAEAVVRTLSVAMHGDQHLVLPLLKLRRFDEYTTTHSLNVCVLAMATAEWLGLGGRDVRAFGISGLLHDLGKVKIPPEVLNKKGKLDEKERAIMNAHPVEGARIILSTEEHLDLAAVVAYEHHIMLNGGGYPKMKYERDCHYASKIVHVCDVYDALRTNRPYRAAWPAGKVLAYLEERSGTEFDGDIAHAFTKMMSTWEPKVALVEEDEAITAS